MASVDDDDEVDLGLGSSKNAKLNKALQNKPTCFYYGIHDTVNDVLLYQQLSKTQINDVFVCNLFQVLNGFPSISLKEPRPIKLNQSSNANVKTSSQVGTSMNTKKKYTNYSGDRTNTQRTRESSREILITEHNQIIKRKECTNFNFKIEQTHLNISDKSKVRYNDLLKTLCMADLSKFPSCFYENKKQFLELLPQVDNLQEKIPEIVDILSKICNSDHLFKNDVLPLVINPEFVGKLVTYISLLPSDYDETVFSVNRIASFFQNLLIFCENITLSMPLKAKGFARNLLRSMQYSITGLKDCEITDVGQSYSEKILELLINLSHDHDNKRIEANNKISRRKKEVIEKEMVPPDHIKRIIILPTKDDLFATHTFLRKNVIDGSYRDVEHYIDVQFRLLREDLIAPLRNAVQMYHKQLVEGSYAKGNRFDNIRIHEGVRILHGTFKDNRFGHLVQLSERFNQSTTRFMFGSLFLFTPDNFDTFFSAIVIAPEGDNMLIVDLKVSPDLINDIYHNHYIMIESEIYFEPYFHVLKALQNINENEFPMKSYIVDVSSERDSSEACFETDCPNSLNESQKKAFNSAMRNEFVAIQGPPGTGKTFLALQITRRILLKFGGIVVDKGLLYSKNDDQYEPEEYVKPCQYKECEYEENLHKKYFHDFFCEYTRRNHSPILLVCYTNHALDQFLEGLLNTTLKCVRVGGQSKNDIVQQFNIKEIRSIWNRREKYARRQCKCYWCMKQLTKLREYILHKRAISRITFSYLVYLKLLEDILTKGLLKVSYLACLMPPHFRNKLCTANQYEHWLLEGHHISPATSNADQHAVSLATSSSQQHFVGPTIIHTNQMVSELRRSTAFLDEPEIDGISEYEAEKAVKAYFSITIEDLEKQKNSLQRKVRVLKKKRVDVSLINLYEDQVKDLELQQQYISYYLKNTLTNPQKIRDLRRTQNIFSLDHEDRWLLHCSWVERFKEHIQREMNELEIDLKHHQDWLKYKQDNLDIKILQSANIIGMTTTGAARLRNLIERVRPTIVIVEEAAEVLEAHVVASLTPSVKKVVLIGDHKQLRPSAAVYKLAKEYNLDVSLFERIVNNGLACQVLNTQHRMRPEISSLIVPAIYPDLKNHDNVKTRPDILGVTSNVFFVTHDHYEDEVPESSSRRNYHEVDFLTSLCEYLLQQGYKSTEITILATYAGQMTSFEMERRKRNLPSDLRITTVDNYQGEENEIILLSLVRSNAEARIGFLSAENRVCVALSRARNGLFIIGNMENLTRNTEIWPKIKIQLDQMEAIGPALWLGCKNHPTSRNSVSKGSDFKGIPNSGCNVKCGAELDCGHVCKKYCHSLADPDHEAKYRCKKPCERMVCEKHQCTKMCGDECEELCNVLVEKTLACGHGTQMSCSMNPEHKRCKKRLTVQLTCGHTALKYCFAENDPICEMPCTFTLDCGHCCDRLCHAETHGSVICNALIEKELSCGHKKNVPCTPKHSLLGTSTTIMRCLEPCKKKLPCDHDCIKLCGDICGSCETLVEKILACGHEAVLECGAPLYKAECHHPCQRQLPCGHPCNSHCSAPCSAAVCEEYVSCPVEPACDHDPIYLPCHLKIPGLEGDSDLLLQHCPAPCRAELPCGHTCTGRCGDCLQGRLHVPCVDMCIKTLSCGHSCEELCGRECPMMCSEPCQYRCPHRQCPDSCGQPCSPCKEPCTRRCTHRQCFRLCSQPCSTPPCDAPCYQTLPCGHPCAGYCGSPCPKHCVLCQPDEFKYPGYDPQSTHRFILLEDCGHSIETELSRSLITRLQENNSVGKCPICNTPIVQISRFKHEIREMFSGLASVNEEREAKLVQTLKDVRRKIYVLKHSESSNYDDFYGEFAMSITEYLKKAYHVNQTSDWVISLFTDIKDVMVQCKLKTCSIQSKYEASNETKDNKLIIERCKLLLRALYWRQESMSLCEYDEIYREVYRVKLASRAWPERRPLLVSFKTMSLDQMLLAAISKSA